MIMTGTPQTLPNILYILSDQHAARVMGCAGDQAADTKNLDRLAKEGVRFSRAYCPSPVCLPSRMSMLTGLQPHEQNCWTNDDILDSSHPTWLHSLGAVGYKPTLIGRMHSLGPDQMRGYTERPIGDHSPNWPGVTRRSLGVLAKTSGPFRESIEKSGPGQSSYQVMDDDVLHTSINFLKDHAAKKTKQPFCLTTSFMLPHPPYVATEDDYLAVKDRVGLPKLERNLENEHPWIKQWRDAKCIGDVAEDDIHRARCSYYALVRQLDRSVGKLLATLEEIGCAKNTFVIYVSDHGDHIGERGLFWKHTFYDESINVPLIMRWPDQIEAGQKIPNPVETGALGNTILSLVGAPVLPNASMTSFSKVLTNPEGEEDRPIFIEYCTDDLPAWAEGFAVQQRAVISEQYKLVYYHGYPCQLFDLDADPAEIHDLCQNPEQAGRIAQLQTLILKDWDPEKIAIQIKRGKADKMLLKAWAENTQPAETCRWELREEQNYLLSEN